MLPSFFAAIWNRIRLCELFWRDVTRDSEGDRWSPGKARLLRAGFSVFRH